MADRRTIHVNTNGNAYFPPHERLVTRRLADAGYDCGLVGKLHPGGAANGREPRVDDGYRSFQYSHAPRDNWPRGHDYADWLREQGVEPSTVLAATINLERDLVEPTPERDPFEFDSRRDDPEHQAIKTELLRKSFDATVRAIEYGPRRVMPH